MENLPETGEAVKVRASDWLAFIMGPAGGGSWARGKDRDDTVRRCLQIYKIDWSGMFELRGAEVVVNLADVSGHDQVTFGERGVFVGDYERGERLDRKLEHFHHIYPGTPRRKGRK